MIRYNDNEMTHQDFFQLGTITHPPLYPLPHQIDAQTPPLNFAPTYTQLHPTSRPLDALSTAYSIIKQGNPAPLLTRNVILPGSPSRIPRAINQYGCTRTPEMVHRPVHTSSVFCVMIVPRISWSSNARRTSKVRKDLGSHSMDARSW